MTQRTKTSLIAKTLLFNALVKCATALDPLTDAIFPTLQGVWYQESSVPAAGLKYLSMAGGAPVSIQGANIGPMPNMNQILFASANFVGVEIPGPILTQSDEFKSNAMAGQLGYTMPSVMELFKTDFDSFNGETLPNGQSKPIAFNLIVHDTDNNWYVTCGTASNCYVQYLRDYTPYLTAVTPANVYKDQLIQFHVNAKNTQSTVGTPADEWPFREIRLGNTLVDWGTDDVTDGTVTQSQRLNGFTHATLEAKVGDQLPAANSEPKLLFYPGYAYNQPSAKTCNFAGDDCWTVRSHPKIESLSTSSGYTNGGQSLNINGWGLDGKNIDIKVDGIPCKVTSQQNDQLTCLTGQATADSDTVLPKLGQPGLLREKIKSADNTKYPYWNAFNDGLYPVVEKNLLTSFETYAFAQDVNYQQRLSGWFTAPATANYRFYMSCDDACRLLLDTVNPFSSGTPTSPTLIAYRNSWTQWRNYFHQNGADGTDEVHISEWISLVEGESYYIEGQHMQWSGGEHFTVSLEIQLPTANPQHPMSNVQIQQLSIDQINTPEQWTLLVANADSGSYKLNFLNPTTSPASLAGPYGPISTKATANVFRDAIAPYYQKFFGCGIQVELTMYDVNQAVTTSTTAAKSYSYKVTVLKQIKGISINSITATKVGTNAVITPTPPIRGIKSSAPINGSYSIVCTDPAGKTWTTPDINYGTNTDWIQNIITNSIPFLADKIDVLPDYRYRHPENGVSFLIRYNGIKGDVTPCQIQSGVSVALTGNTPTYNNPILVEAGKSLMFEPIPLEFLRTPTHSPQVLVSIDGFAALCANLTCDYSYYTDGSTISTQARTGSALAVTGSLIPFADIVQVGYGKVKCDVASATDSNIDCTLAGIPVAGLQTVQVTTVNGLIPVDINFVPTEETLTVTSVSPNTDVNYLGGDLLVIQGSGFGTDATAVNVTLDDGTVCEVVRCSSTAVVCQTERFSNGAVSPLTVRISVNEAQDVSQTITLLPQAQTSEAVVPNRVSPVLKQNLVISLSSNYSGTIDINDFSVFLINDNDPKTLKPLYIISVDDAAKKLKVKFPGAHSGNYKLRVVSAIHGRIDTDGLGITVISQVFDYQPKQGSIYGGTTVTITGENFSNDPLDNPVKIGDHYCYVETSSPTQITCKTDLLQGDAFGEEQLLVFLKTSEEAGCGGSTGCFFTYVTPQATVLDVVTSFDPQTQHHIATVSGSGFDQSIRLVLDGIEQNQLTFTDSSATFQIVDLDDSNVTHVEVFTSEGYPNGAGSLPYLELTPSLLSISPLVGSAGGSKIIVTGTGFGLGTQGLNLFDSKTGKLLCSKVSVLSYGSFSCLTNPVVITDGSGIQLAYGTKRINSQDVSATSYTQSASIVLTGATLSSQTITITGSGFSGSNLIPTVSFGGVDADTTTVVSDTEVVADWSSTGVAAINASPVLRFTSVSNVNIVHFAQNPTTIKVSKILNVDNAATQSVTCSFQGGCKYSVAADGLFSALKDSNNRIDICGKPCKVDETQSSSTQTVCSLPSVATAYSVSNFKIQESGVLSGTVFPANTPVLTDGDLTIDYVSTASTGCNFGMNFPEGQVAVLDEAKIFINFMTTVTPYANKLAFYGSNDNWATSTLIDTIGDNVHEGWNYLNYRDDGNNKPAFSSYKFQGSASGSCRVTEFRLTGVQSFADNNNIFSCVPKVIIGTATNALLSPVTFSAAATPLLTSIWPRFGSVLGGDTVTLTGENFSNTALTVVKFDNRLCSVVSQSSTQIVCTTANKPYVPDTPKVEIIIEGQGLVSTQGLVFRYVSLWSEPQTWGFDIPPQEGESISIPKGQHLLVDVDKTPQVFAVIVEGSLIFAPDADPSHHREFDAHYVMVEGGYMEVGTEDFPYTSHLTITMHSDKYSPYLPIYGNKVIGVRFGQLEMHGVTREVTWTTLSQTANAGDSQIYLDKVVDWNIGEEIVIAGTVFENVQSETRFITAVNGNIVTLDQPLEFSHLGEVPTFGNFDIPMKAEVGLLTRNVLYRGDPETSSVNQYGAHIMIHSPGDESSIGRICYIEMKDVGQAFKLGRYPIHFHMIGTVHQSHVIGNAIHQTYNRAITTHGVQYFTVQHNVAYDTMGHTYFIEDAAETNNYYDHNLAIKIKKSMSLLNTDQTPGGFWITHPNNIFTNNAIANGEAYGFWFDMKEHSTGPSFDVNICGFNDKLGQFSNNSAHSVHKYGLRIFHGLIPRTYPCKSLIYDGDYEANGQTDPYWKNPVIPAVFEDSVFWRNGVNGAIMERSGAVIFKNLKCADNGVAGMEYSLTEDIADGYAKIQGGIVVGDTGLTTEVSDYLRLQTRVTGIITPRTENFTIDGVTFFNYDWGTSSALKDCSHCWHPASTDSGARTVKTTGLTFDDTTVPRRIKYEIPKRGIWNDLDGSLTGLGPNTWATRDYVHNRQPECQVNDDVYNGIICDSTVQIRRIVFHGYTPQSLDAMLLNVAQWEDSQVAAVTADNTTLFDFQQDVDQTRFSRVEYRQKLAPLKSWAVPFVTGHKYRLHWGWANDFDTMSVTPSNRWLPSDKNVHIMTNFTDVRVAINVTTKYGSGDIIANKSYLSKLESELVSGDNVIFNQTEVREFKFVINGKNLTDRGQLKLTGIRCWPGSCLAPVIVVPINDNEVYWSDPTAWPSGKIPVENDTVAIGAGVNMILDINTPILQLLTIKGRLRFLQNDTAQDLTLNARIIFVAGGELIIGNETAPYNGTATIKLFGISTDQTLAYDSSIYGGNKMLANLGLVSFWGKSRSRNSRLRQPIYTGNNSALVSPGLDWVAGDRVYLAPTATQYTHSDYMNIASYDIQTGLITFTEKVQYYHWGDYQSTATAYNGVDMRGEVVLLTRNVRVIGDDTMSWGGHVVTSDTMDDLGNLVTGQLFFSNVELYNCSQENTYQTAIRFEGAQTKHHLVQNTVVHEGHGWSFLATMSANILIKDSDFIGARVIGFSIQTSSNVTVDGVMQADVIKRKLTLGGGNHFVDKEGCFSICAYNGPEICKDVSIKNSVATGCAYAGFVVPGHTCGRSATQQVFRNNIAHSSEGSGAVIFPDGSNEQLECYEGSYFSAYKCGQAGIASMFVNKRMNMTQITMIDNVKGIALQQGAQFDVNMIEMNRAVIYGETAAKDCPDPQNKDTCLCVDKMGFMLSGSNEGKKEPHINSPSMLPMYKIKSYGAYHAATNFEYITFSKWLSNETDCGARQSIFALNPYSSDYVPLQKFSYSKFTDVSDDAIAYIYDPPEGWNNPDDCVGFPCTAPSNVVITHDGVQYSGLTKPASTSNNFQIVSDTASASQILDKCQKKEAWNALSCVNSYLGVLVFQSLDDDQEKRNIAPVYVYNDETWFNNTLNSMMDHVWDGFYTGQFHKSMFGSLIQTTGNYTIMTTGTVPGKMRYSLRADRGAMKVKVPYWNAGAYQVKVNNVVIPYTSWDANAGTPSELTGRKGCGENRFVGVKNFLEFWLTAGCTVDVVPVDAILANVRMEWTLAEFYAKGGVVSFTDRVSAALGIQAYQVKTVAVYQGSVIVQYTVSTPNDDTTPTATLAKLTTKLNALVSSPDANKIFGAPILNATTNSATIVGGQSKPTTTPTTTTPVVTPAPIIQDTTTTTTVTVPKVTTSTATATPSAESPKNQTQVIVIVIVVLVLAIAAAVATGVFIKNRLRKATLDAATASQEGANSQGAIVQNSEVALEPQFNAEGAAFDIDIFTNKKRAMKKFNDDEVAQKYYDESNQFSSNAKLSATDANSRIELTNVKAK